MRPAAAPGSTRPPTRARSRWSAAAWPGTRPIRPTRWACSRRSAASSTPPWPGSSSALVGCGGGARGAVVVGGGGAASRRVPSLLDAGAEIFLVSPKVTASLEDLAAAGRIRWEARGYQPGDCAGAWLVCACTDDPAVNAAVAAEAEAQRTWCVRADNAGLSAAWTPASGRAGDVRVGIISGDPRHGAALRAAGLDALRSGALSARHGRHLPGGFGGIVPPGQQSRGGGAVTRARPAAPPPNPRRPPPPPPPPH